MKRTENKLNIASVFVNLVHSDKSDVDFNSFRTVCFRNGIPDTAGIRQVCYKVLFEYMPFERSLRKPRLEERRALYFAYIDDFLSHLSEFPSSSDPPEDLAFEQIDKDVRRTLSDFAFLHSVCKAHPRSRLHPLHEESLYKASRKLFLLLKDTDTTFGAKSHGGSGGRTHELESPDPDFPMGEDYHWEVLERILYVFNKLNPGIGYVQGMNELLGPIYYLFATDPNEDGKEPDAFWVFFSLVSEMKEVYMKSMDNDKSKGINASMARLYDMLRLRDIELYRDFDEKGIHPAYFSFRWLSLILAQEFDLPDLLRLWDSIFSDKDRFKFLLNVCCAMLINVREELLSGGFNENVKLLQNYPCDDINPIIEMAYRLYDEDTVDGQSAELSISSPSPTVSTASPKSPMAELAGIFSPALQSISSTITGLTNRKPKSNPP